MRVLVVVPARLGSTRLKAKVLADLGGLPVVERVRRAAQRARVGPVVVATDSDAVAEAVRRHGGTAVLTGDCASGTDRVWAALPAAERLHRRRFDAVINLQGDEPLIRPGTIKAVVGLLKSPAAPDIATAVCRLRAAGLRNPDVVKVAMAADGRCLYFSRAPIPWAVNGSGAPPVRHIGIYGYRRRALRRFVRLRPSPLELSERLEQLRALEDGMTLYAARVREDAVSIDTAADLARARKRLQDDPRSAHG